MSEEQMGNATTPTDTKAQMSTPSESTAAVSAGQPLLGRISWSGGGVSWLAEAALIPVLVLLVIVGTIVSPAFLTVSNLTGIGQQVSSLGIIVIGESFILLTGGMDLSLESTYGLAPMIAAWLILPISAYGNGSEISPYLGILVLLAVGAAVGLFNGLVIVKGKVNGFILTLA